MTARYHGHDAFLQALRRYLPDVYQVQEVFVGDPQSVRLLPAARAFSQVVLDLPLFAWFQRAHHVGAEEVPHLRMLTHPQTTGPRRNPWSSRAGRVVPPWCGSSPYQRRVRALGDLTLREAPGVGEYEK